MPTPIENNTEALKQLKVKANALPDKSGATTFEITEITLLLLGQLVDLPDANIIIMRNGSTQETYKLGAVNFTFDIAKDSIGIIGVPCYDYTFNIDGNTLNILALDKINPSDKPSVPLLDGWTIGSAEWQYSPATKAPDISAGNGKRYIIIPDTNIDGYTVIFLWWTDEYTNGEIHNIQYLLRHEKIASNEHEVYCTLTSTEKLNNGFKISFNAVNGDTVHNKVNYLYGRMSYS